MLYSPEAARAALKEDLAPVGPARSIHNPIVLVDLARTYTQQGEVKYPMSKDKGLLRRLPHVGYFLA